MAMKILHAAFQGGVPGKLFGQYINLYLIPMEVCQAPDCRSSSRLTLQAEHAIPRTSVTLADPKLSALARCSVRHN
jgi:hypothetical protein